jgi:hypothetical protein
MTVPEYKEAIYSAMKVFEDIRSLRTWEPQMKKALEELKFDKSPDGNKIDEEGQIQMFERAKINQEVHEIVLEPSEKLLREVAEDEALYSGAKKIRSNQMKRKIKSSDKINSATNGLVGTRAITTKFRNGEVSIWKVREAQAESGWTEAEMEKFWKMYENRIDKDGMIKSATIQSSEDIDTMEDEFTVEETFDEFAETPLLEDESSTLPPLAAYSDLHAALDAFQSGEISPDEAQTRIEDALVGVGVEAEEATEVAEIATGDEISSVEDFDEVLESRGILSKVKKTSLRSRRIRSEVEETLDSVPTAEENVEDDTTFYSPEIMETVEEPIEGDSPVEDTKLTSEDVSPESPEIDSDAEGAPDYTVVGSPDNSEVEEIGIMGDEGVFIENTSPEEIHDEFNFDSEVEIAVEIPVKDTNDTQVLEMNEVQPGVYTLSRAYIRQNAGKSTSVRKGKAASQFLQFSKLRKSPLKVNLQSKVVLLQATQKALIFQHSNILGVIAVEAPILKGIVNSKYDLFTLKKGRLVSSSKKELSSSTHNRVIASVTSNRGVKPSTLSRNLFSEVERAYVSYLQSKIRKIASAKRLTEKRLSSRIKILSARLLLSKKRLASETSSLQKKLLESTQTLSSLRQSVVDADRVAQDIRNSGSEREARSIQSRLKKESTERLMRQMQSL